MKRVTVLMGGHSAERAVSLVSGMGCAHALKEAGYTVETLDAKMELPALLAAIQAQSPDVVFIALHGRFGEDGNIQGALNLLHLPYTHSGLMASAIAMDKPLAKMIFEANGLRCATGLVMTRDEVMKGDPMARPYVVKPANEGSSVGVHIVRAGDNANLFAGIEWTYGDRVLVERYIEGRELTVGVMGGKAMEVTELRPKLGFYDYRNKYTDGMTEHLCPAPLEAEVAAEARRMAEVAHASLGCRGITRADFRYDDTGARGKDALYLLEINTQPGMTALSLVPEQAKAMGITYPELVRWMVEHAEYDA